MNIYGKLQQARIDLQSAELKKSGLNKFAGFQYFELADFLPTVNQIFHKHGLSSTVCFTSDSATLVLHDVENQESATFTCPVVVPTMKGCNEIQALGAMMTYTRRYLYVNALEIVEHDAIDATTGQSGKPTQVPEFKPNDEEWAYLTDIVAKVIGCGQDYSQAADYLAGVGLDADEKVWVWDKLDSKTRSAIKKYNQSLKEKEEI